MKNKQSRKILKIHVQEIDSGRPSRIDSKTFVGPTTWKQITDIIDLRYLIHFTKKKKKNAISKQLIIN